MKRASPKSFHPHRIVPFFGHDVTLAEWNSERKKGGDLISHCMIFMGLFSLLYFAKIVRQLCAQQTFSAKPISKE